MINQTHTLDVIPGGNVTVVHVKQYQTDESLIFKLYSRFGSFTISAAYTSCTVRGTKSDGNGYSATATCDTNTKQVWVELTEQMTAVAGRQPYEITITDSIGKMITATFILDVQRAALDADTVTSESLIQEIETAAQEQVADYIADHPGLFIVDDTLTQSGQAADAKKTGDEITDLKSALGNLNDLETETKTDLVSAINEANQNGGSQNTGAVSETLKQILENMMDLFGAVSLYNDTVDVASIGSETNDLIDSLTVIVPDLTGIDAVFNQTGSLYSDATLNDLKQYLTVTGTYEDGTTREITNYTLSGTIAVGTQTITVTVDNFTDTFTVIISSADIWYELPQEKTIASSEDVVMTGIRPFEEDNSFTLYVYYNNSGANTLYSTNENTASQSIMRGGGTSTGNTTIIINGTTKIASSKVQKFALKHTAGTDKYTYYFSKTGIEFDKEFSASAGELRLGGWYSDRSDLAFRGTIYRFIVYRRALTDEEIATLWDGGTI